MRLIELPGPSIFNLDCIAVAAYKPARIEAVGPLQASCEIITIAGPRLTIEGLAAQILWHALKQQAIPLSLPAAEKPT